MSVAASPHSAEPKDLELVNKYSGALARQRIYLGSDGLVQRSFGSGEVLQTQVLWDDVVLITHRRFVRKVYAGLMGVTGTLALLFGAWWLSWQELFGGGVFLTALGGLLAVAALLQVLITHHEVTVCGRRSQVRLRLRRQEQARRLYGRLCQQVRDLQLRDVAELQDAAELQDHRSLAGDAAAPAAPTGSPLPNPPPAPSVTAAGSEEPFPANQPPAESKS